MIICYCINFYNIPVRLSCPSLFYWSSMYQESSFSLFSLLVANLIITIVLNFFTYILLPLEVGVNSSISQIWNDNINIHHVRCDAGLDHVSKVDWEGMLHCKVLPGDCPVWLVLTHHIHEIGKITGKEDSGTDTLFYSQISREII